jgi:hypothetical protein
MPFSREQIKKAKVGEHLIRWSPDQEPVRVWVTKVRGDHVWVRLSCLDVAKFAVTRLNKTVSDLLMKDQYRPKS